MTCTIRFANDESDMEFDSIQMAVAALKAEDPTLAIEGAGGYVMDEDDEDDAYDVRRGIAARVYDGDDRVAIIEVEEQESCKVLYTSYDEDEIYTTLGRFNTFAEAEAAIIARFGDHGTWFNEDGDTLYHTGPEIGCGSAWVVAL